MNTLEFLSELRSLGIQISTDGEKLRLHAPKDALTPSLRGELAERKAEIIALLQNTKRLNYSTELPIQPIARNQERDLPLSFAQQRLWFLDQLEPNNPFYNIPKAIRLNGNLNIQILEQALDAIVAHHEILRTNYICKNGNPIQVIAAPQSVQLQIIDLQEYEKAERETQVQTILQQESQRPFNLASDMMLRGCLLQLGHTEYVLLLVMHHIASDGWSMGILWSQLTQLYKAFKIGKPNPLTKLPIQYADYAVWQRKWLTGEVLERQLNYWKQQLAQENPLLELPTDKPRPPVKTYNGARQSLTLSQTLSDKLKQLFHQQGVTLYMGLLAGFQTLLYRYSKQEDVLVGSPIAGRNRIEVEGLIGFFVNTLVLRTDFSGNPSFLELLSRVQQVAIEAYQNEDLPFEKLVEEIQPQRSLAYSPLFQVMFVLQNTLKSKLELPGVTLNELNLQGKTAKFDLTLSITETERELVCNWGYNTDLFNKSTIERMAGHFKNLLSAIVENPQQQVSQLPLLSKSEQHQLLVEWNNTATEYPKNKCVHQLFEEQVERNPDAIAITFNSKIITYNQLNNRANQLAHYLRSIGVNPEDKIGICVERSIEMIVGLLAILKAGGAYVPLDPDYPEERIDYMLKDSGISILIAKSEFVEKISAINTKVISLDKQEQVIASQAQENPVNQTNSHHLAYIIYTSGSTGKPKGVAVTHLGINRLVNNTNYIKLQPSDKIAQSSNTSFDAATFEIWGALLLGAQLVGVPREIALEPEKFVAHLQEQQITVAFLTTALFNQFAALIPTAFKSLRYLLFGGEAVDPNSVKKILQHGKPENLLHVYGPTENTTFSSWYLVEEVPEEATTIPIGIPIANTQIYILDNHLQPVPIGIPGEIYLGGDGLAQGYLNRPEITSEKFIPNPFSFEPNSRLYKTGDLARYLRDGNIEYINRIDNQVKIRGFRIELAEIEAILNEHPQVTASVAITREDIPGDKRLVAYIVCSEENTNTITTKLREFLAQELPQYMIPNSFVVLNALPLTPNGKVDRKALPAPDTSNPQAKTFVAPRNTLELQLVKIWEKVLGIQPIGVTDNFFELGGHSLLTIRLVAEIEKVTQKKLPLAALFQFTTISELASIITQCEVADDAKKNLSTELLALDTDDLRALLTVAAGRGGTRLRPDSLMNVIRSQGDKPPLFYCVNGMKNISNLAPYLGEEQPIYILESGYSLFKRKSQLNNPCSDNIKAIAALHVRDILTVNPTGPYLIAGYSFGKYLAYETAKQLQERGKKVAMLAILDTTGSGKKYRYYVQKIQPALIAMKKELLDGSLLNLTRKIGLLLLKVKDDLTVEGNRGGYLMQGYSGKLTLFIARYAHRRHIKIQRWLFPAMGWENHAVKTIKVPGGHYTMLSEPHVRVLASELKTCINKATQD